jgi:hypothetical protein
LPGIGDVVGAGLIVGSRDDGVVRQRARSASRRGSFRP